MIQFDPELITQDNFNALIAARANAMQAALDIINGVARPAPLCHIRGESIPRRTEPENERQQVLDRLDVDTSQPRINCLLDPVTLAAIEHPRLLTGDTTGRYFEYHTLMALSRSADGTFAHPLTRGRYIEAQIVDASAEYKELFDKTVAEIRAEQEAGPDRPGPP